MSFALGGPPDSEHAECMFEILILGKNYFSRAYRLLTFSRNIFPEIARCDGFTLFVVDLHGG